MAGERYLSYLAALKTNFTKIAKLEFLNRDGSVAFALDNDPKNKRSGAFLQSGDISCNLNNGMRRQASVTLSNLDGEFDFAVNHIWYGTQLRLSEGLLLPDGSEYLIPQGVFEIEQPNEHYKPSQRTTTWRLVDKWANLDGTLGGNLEGAYSISAGTNIFTAIAALLQLDRYTMENNGSNPIDPVTPNFTSYYNGKSQTLTDGTTALLVNAPYDYLSGDQEALSDVMLGLAEMLAAWIGYGPTGRLTVDPSQDDISDSSKPILWDFTTDEKQLLGVQYTIHKSDVYNDLIVVGDTNDAGATAKARAQNKDISSDTCISRIGLKTQRIHMANYYSDQVCRDYAVWKLKRSAALQKSVDIYCTQMFHIVENGIVTIRRDDKPGSPVERHVVQGWTRPIGQTGEMTINAISVVDYPDISIIRENLSTTNAVAGYAIAGVAIAGKES